MNAPLFHPASAVGHVTPVSENGWSLWRLAECRSAGFPAAMVLGLGSPECAAAADRYCTAAAANAQQWGAVRRDLKERIRALLERQRNAALGSCVDALEGDIRMLRKAVKAVDRQQGSEALAAVIPAGQVAALAGASAQAGAALASFEALYASAAAAATGLTSQLAAMPRFREAVTWQNFGVVGTVLDILGQGGVSAGRRRRSEDLVAGYLQRYTTKNDTIGFFGPTGWAGFDPHGAALQATAGPRLLASRTTYFEDWAIHALTDKLSACEQLRPWFSPWKMPYLRLEGEVLHLPGDCQVRLSREEAAVLAACDGLRTTGQITAALLAHPFLAFDCADDVLAVLERFRGQQRICWGFAFRVGDCAPERHLRAQIEAIDEHALRAACLADLDRLEQARAAVSAAADRTDGSLANAMQALNATFEQVSDDKATRRGGETYGARTVVYEDCRRDLRIDFGPALLARLQPALDLVLLSARWYCHRLAQALRCALTDAFAQLHAAAPARPVEFSAFWLQAQTLFFGERPFDTAGIDRELSSKWESVLALGPGHAAVRRDSDALRSAVLAAFDAPDCGWRGACHQSPDVMIAARTAEAIAAGEGLFVLGEVHMGLNTLIVHSALNQCPDAQGVLAALRADRGAQRLIPLLARDGTRQPIRVQTVCVPGQDAELCFSHDARPLDPASALAIGELVVTMRDGALKVATRDGKRQFDVLDVFGEFMSGFAAGRFHMFGPRAHCPRICIDDLVIQRRSWRFGCDDLPFLQPATDSATYAAVRAWWAAAALPRFVFVKLPWEQKPFYLDFDSAAYVRTLVKQLRNMRKQGVPGASMALSEMLPAHDQTWLPDGEGNTYTCELRFVAIHADDRAAGSGA